MFQFLTILTTAIHISPFFVRNQRSKAISGFLIVWSMEVGHAEAIYCETGVEQRSERSIKEIHS